jgi:hypothetical protein
VDTGASFSIFPHHSSAIPSGPALFGPAGKLIPCWEEKADILSLNGRRFEDIFTRPVSFPIIGVDFLRHYGLLVDLAANRLVDPKNCEYITTVPCLSSLAASTVTPAAKLPLTPASTPQSPASNPQPLVSPAAPLRPPSAAGVKAPSGFPAAMLQAANSGSGSLLDQLERSFPGVFNASQVLPPATHGVEHHLVTSVLPITSKYRRLDGEKLAVPRSEFAKMEKDGIVQRSTSHGPLPCIWC